MAAQRHNFRLLPQLPDDADGSFRALALDPNKARDRAIIDAFSAFQLDHRDPYHWRILMTYFADAHFGRNYSGRPRSWTAERLLQLRADYFKAVVIGIRLNGSKLSDEDACQRLVEDRKNYFEQRYKGMKPATLRRQLPKSSKLVRQLGR